MDSEFEEKRILNEYHRRSSEIPSDFYSLTRPVNLFFHYQRNRTLLPLLKRENILPFQDKEILDVGCGSGDWLLEFVSLGSDPERISGIELIESRYKSAQRRLPVSDIRNGNACELPWSDNKFDVVTQSVVFTSILDIDTKKKVAQEMMRVLKPNGCIIWFDFRFNNPKNKNVKGIGQRELTELFPKCDINLKKVLLAPPIARIVVPISWTIANVLCKIGFLRTHYIGLIRPNSG